MASKIELFVPGRLCLFGEHSDWAGYYRTINAAVVPGMAVVTGIDQGIYATAEKADVFMVTSSLDMYRDQDFSCPMNVADLQDIASTGGYFSYVAGVASYVKEHYNVGGLHIDITRRTLPVKRGLSSSAAVCVLVAQAFNELYKLNLNTLGIMNIAYMGEQRTPSRCGRLDQACAFGKHPVMIRFDGNQIHVERLIIKKPLYWLFADLNAEKDTIKILSSLNKCYPFAQNDLEKHVHEALGIINQDIVTRAMQLMTTGDAPALGALMDEAQARFDEMVLPVCPEELTAPTLHRVLSDQTVRSMIYGGKGVGSQGDGSVQFLARSKEDQEALALYLHDHFGMEAFNFTIKPQRAIRKAIIPVAGFGTRLYPATRTVKKEFLPVIDQDGLAKPILFILLEQLVASGMEEICLVVSPHDLAFYQQVFADSLSAEHKAKLSAKMLEYEAFIVSVGKKIRLVVQQEALGFGHAVYQCNEFVQDEPVLLLLGDTIYQSHTNQLCSQQLIDAYEQTGLTTLAIHSIPLPDVIHYGITTGNWENSDQDLLKITKMVEKPGVEYAEDFLGVDCTYQKKYFSVFGQYVLTPDIFRILGDQIRNGVKTGDEYQLTTALDEAIEKHGVYGYVVNGRMFDIGTPSVYRETFHAYGR